MDIKLEDRIIIVAGPTCSCKNKIINKLEEDIENSLTISCLENDVSDCLSLFNEIAINLSNNNKVLIVDILGINKNIIENLVMFLEIIDYNGKINLLKLNLSNINYITDNIDNIINTLNQIKEYNSENGLLNNKLDGINEYIVDDLANINIEYQNKLKRSLTRNYYLV